LFRLYKWCFMKAEMHARSSQPNFALDFGNYDERADFCDIVMRIC